MVILGQALAALLLAGAPAQAQQASTAAVVAASSEAATVTLTAVGDIRLDGPVGQIIAREGMAAPTAAVRERLRGDIVLGNLECPLTQGGIRVLGKTWTFRAPARNLEALKAAGFNLLNIANNHVMDYGPKGFRDTLAALEREGLPYVGGGKDRADAMKLHIATVKGLRVGVLAGTQVTAGAPWRIVLTEEVRRRLSCGDAPSGWVGLTEAARHLGLSKSAVAYLVNTGKLPAVHTTVAGRTCWRIDVSSTSYANQAGLFDPMSNDETMEA